MVGHLVNIGEASSDWLDEFSDIATNAGRQKWVTSENRARSCTKLRTSALDKLLGQNVLRKKTTDKKKQYTLLVKFMKLLAFRKFVDFSVYSFLALRSRPIRLYTNLPVGRFPYQFTSRLYSVQGNDGLKPLQKKHDAMKWSDVIELNRKLHHHVKHANNKEWVQMRKSENPNTKVTRRLVFRLVCNSTHNSL